jgi:hypothetical protein
MPHKYFSNDGDLGKSRPIHEITSPQMPPSFPDDPASRFLDYYGQFLIAKRQEQPQMIWLNALACRKELQKMRDPANEAQHCEMIFKGFVTQEKAAEIYRELYEESSLTQSAGKLIAFPVAS